MSELRDSCIAAFVVGFIAISINITIIVGVVWLIVKLLRYMGVLDG